MFIHLHNHSDYSLLDGLCRIPQLIDATVEYDASAVGLTDHGNMFGALEFYTKAKEKGIKPILGCEFYIASGSRLTKKTVKGEGKGGEIRYHLVLLAKNYTGYKNLSKLSSESYINGFYYKPRIDKELLNEYNEGLICLSGCVKGEIPQLIIDGNLDAARKSIQFYHDLFGEDYYLEIMRHGIKNQEKVIPHLAQFGEDFGIKLVVTNDAHYMKKEHAKAQDILLCVGTQAKVNDIKRLRFETNEFYYKSPDEMIELFHDYPEAIMTTLEIADKCDLEIELGENHYPVFELPDEIAAPLPCPAPPSGVEIKGGNADKYLRQLTMVGFKERYGENPPEEAVRRVENELNVISQTGFSNYFLIVWDFVRWAKEQGIPVGPGRGSAAGCTVSYNLGITNLDPTRYGLIFERFLNLERVSPPDIDIDFSDEKRESVIDYVREKYGADSVCRITTFGKMAAKSAVRDVARTLSLSFAESDKIARLIPEGPKVKLAESFSEVPELKKLIESDPRYREVWDNALIIEGSVRHSGTHAAGVVICPGRTVDFIPVYKMGGEGEEYTQYDMNWVDKLGLLKMDFLGLQTLSELDMTVHSAAKRGINIDLEHISLEDENVFKLFGDGATVGVFQFESGGMRDNLSKLKPERIEDLLAMCALYRPGPMDNIPTYIACRHGQKRPYYTHLKLESILKETYGVITYQEQVMRIATDLAGFSLGKADILRWAMGKKKMDLMKSLKKEFIEGFKNNAIGSKIAESIWKACEQFAKYGFVKAHAAGYALIAYQCAYLKANYPADYLASCLTVRRKNPNMVMKLLAECRALGVQVLPPDINESDYGFVATSKGILFGLVAIKSLGDAAVNAILTARKEHEHFASIHDFLMSVDLRVVNKRVIENLIDAGAFDAFGVNRATLLESLPGSVAYAQAIQEERERGQTTLFGGVGVDPAVHIPPPDFHHMDEWPPSELQSREKAVLGYYVTSHPLERFKDEIEGLANHRLADRDDFKDGMQLKTCGVVTSVKVKPTRKGDKWATVQIEDLTGSIDCLLFQPTFDKVQDLLFADQLVAISGRISKRDKEDETKLRIEDMIPLESASVSWGHSLRIRVESDRVTEPLVNRLEQIFNDYKGKTPVYIDISYTNGTIKTLKVSNYLVQPAPELVDRLTEIIGKDRVKVGY